MGNEKLTRRECVRLQRRQEMLTAACGLFSERGYHSVSMQEIAEKAEFAIGTLYNFFQNKEDLYNNMVLELCDRFENEIFQTIEGPEDEIGKLRSYIRLRYGKFREYLPLFRFIFGEASRAGFDFSEGLEKQVRKRRHASLERLASIFESAIEKKKLKKILDPFCLALVLDSFLDAFCLLKLEIPECRSNPDVPENIFDVLMNGLMMGGSCQVCEAEHEQS